MNYGVFVGTTGVSVGVNVEVGVSVAVGGTDVLVEVGGTDVLVAGAGVFVGLATTIETVNVEPKGLPACVPNLHVPVYEPGCFGAVN